MFCTFYIQKYVFPRVPTESPTLCAKLSHKMPSNVYDLPQPCIVIVVKRHAPNFQLYINKSSHI